MVRFSAAGHTGSAPAPIGAGFTGSFSDHDHASHFANGEAFGFSIAKGSRRGARYHGDLGLGQPTAGAGGNLFFVETRQQRSAIKW